jgi:cell wall-associated NlpC family hydrolase
MRTADACGAANETAAAPEYKRREPTVAKDSSVPVATQAGPVVADFVDICLRQRGDRYEWGAKPPPSNPDPEAFDCSGLVWWALARLHVPFPEGSWLQLQECEHRKTMIEPYERAFAIRGALLFRHDTPADGHVAVSLGNGSTIEARGKQYGVNKWPAQKRHWTHAAYVPGLRYGVHSTEGQS